MKILGHLTEKSSKVKISATPTVSFTSSPRRMARSILDVNTSGLSVKPVEKVDASDPNPTGKHTMDPVTYSKLRSKILTNPSSDEKLCLYTAPKVV